MSSADQHSAAAEALADDQSLMEYEHTEQPTTDEASFAKQPSDLGPYQTWVRNPAHLTFTTDSTPSDNIVWRTRLLRIALPWHGRQASNLIPIPVQRFVPSPVCAASKSWADAIRWFLNRYYPEAVYALYRACQEEQEDFDMYNGMASSHDGLVEERRYGYIAYLDEAITKDQSADQRDDWEASRAALFYRRVEQDCLIRTKLNPVPHYRTIEGTQQPVLASMSTNLDIRRLPGELPNGAFVWGFHLVNLGKSDVIVNGQRLPPQRVAGPLPNFAVIHWENAAAFWWHSLSARDYAPDGIPQSLPFIASGDAHLVLDSRAGIEFEKIDA